MNFFQMNRKYNWVERNMIRRMHPRRIFVDAAGLPWVVYFIWRNDWVMALVSVAVSTALGLFATRTVDVDAYGRTIFGKIALLHLRPMNFTLQVIGIAAFVWATWSHFTMGILGSVSLIFIGHLDGWEAALTIGEGRETIRKVA